MSKTGSSEPGIKPDDVDVLNIKYKPNAPGYNESWKTIVLNTNVIGLTIIHVIGVVGMALLPWTKTTMSICFFSIFFRLWAVTCGYHRYFSHKSYQTSRWFQCVLAFLGGMAVQHGALWWAGHHRHHHKFADTDPDPHSPTLKGFFWSHMGWFLLSGDHEKSKYEYLPDLVKYPELMFLDKYDWIPPIIYGLGWYFTFGFEGFMWGMLIATILLHQVIYTINSLAHVYGTVRYKLSDTSKNNWFLAILTLGEGWHNNHHAYKAAARNGFFWWEVDFTYYTLLFMEKIGLVWNLRMPPLEKLKVMEVGYVATK